MSIAKKPFYPDDRRIDMTAYIGPRRAGKHIYNGKYGAYPWDPEEGYPSFITDEVFELYKNAGLNFLMPEEDAFYGERLTENGFVEERDFKKSNLYEYMQIAERHGLGVYPAIREVFGHMAREEGPFGDEEKEVLRDFVETIQAHFPNTFRGIMLTDEPEYFALPRIKKIMNYLRSEEIAKIKPDMDIFTSMLPIYGLLRYFHPDYQDGKYKGLKYDEHRKRAYQYYMEQCADAVGEFSFDYYALIYADKITPGFYLNMEMAAEHCKEHNYPFAITLQSFRMDVDYNEKTGRSLMVYRTPHYEDMRWQVYSALAFGVQRIGYYTFWTHYSKGSTGGQPNAMVVFDPAEEKYYRTTEIYDATKAINEEILKFDHVFLRFQWEGCRVVRTSRDRNIRLVKGGYEGGNIVSEKATRDLLIGCMKNPEDGMEGYWIVNAENPFRAQINDVEVIFEGATRLAYYRKGKEYDIPLEQIVINGKTCGIFQIRLGVGEGIFAIPY